MYQLESLKYLFHQWKLVILTTIIAATLLVLIIKHLKNKHRAFSNLHIEHKQDGVVVLHQFPSTPYTPCPSPYCLKIETFLRITKIPYRSVYGYELSSKGKVPWIEYNGKSVADSNFIVEFLCKEFDISLYSYLNSQERAVANAFLRMIEENSVCTLTYHIWLEAYETTKREINPSLPFYMKPLFCPFIRHFAKKNLYGQGMGRHNADEVRRIAEQDLTSLSAYLGDKDFIMGATPCLVDAAAFGFLAQCLWLREDSPHALFIKENAQNLEKFCKTMKMIYFPDWEDLLCHS